MINDINIDRDKNLKSKELYKDIKMTYGRKLFNECLPDDYPIINTTVTKDLLFEILNDIALKYKSNITMKVLDNLKILGFEVSSNEGFTLSLDELYDEELEEYVNNINYGDDEIDKNMKKLQNKKILNKIKNKPYYIYTESGARGSMTQLQQICLSRGYVSDYKNNIIPHFIKSNYVTGMNQKDVFFSSYGSRKSLLDTAHSTAASGYLTRQSVYSETHMVLDEEVEDCNTDEYLELNIEVKNPDGSVNDKSTEKLAKSLIWRYIIVGDTKPYLITKENYKAIVGRKIKLRSPVYCKSKNICKTCYGNMHKILHSTNIGLISAHSISEKSTQLVLRSHHVSGFVKTGSNKNSKKSEDIVSDISVLNKLLHTPNKSFNITKPEQLILQLYKLFAEHGNVHLIHFEVLVTAMMWYNDKIWRTMKNRNNYPYTFESILQIPSKQSWLLGVAFSRLKYKLIDGLINKSIDVPTSISNIFRY